MWYSNFFHGLPQRTWREAQSDEQTQLELELLVESLEFGPGERVLDVFCGYGRHTLPLAKMGADVVGVDISDESVGELQVAAKQAKVSLKAIAADFTTLRADVLGGTESFRAAYCLGNSFSFFPHNRMALFVQQMADLLEADGRLLVHSGMVAECLLPAYQERVWMPVGDDIQVLMENDYDPTTAQLTQHLTYLRHTSDGTETARRTAEYTIYTVAELVRFFQDAGLRVLDTYGTVMGDPFAIGDEGIWLLAEK